MKIFFLAFALLSAHLACGQVQVGGSNNSAANGVVVSLVPSTMPIGGTVRAYAKAVLADGSINAYQSSVCSWSSDTPTIATVPAAANAYFATVTGIANGTAVITCAQSDAQGNPTFTGSATVTVVAAPAITNPNAAGCGTPPCALSQATNGSPYSFQFTAALGVAPYTWNVSVGSLPAWASLNSANGTISGTPNANATTNFTIRVADSSGINPAATLAVSLTVVAGTASVGNDAYCTAGVANFGTTDGPAALPVANAGYTGEAAGYCTNLSLAQNQSPQGQLQGDIANGASAATVQGVINAAVCGEIIKFAAGAVISGASGSVTLPNKSCADGNYIQITVDTASIPAEGQRTTPCWWGVASLPGRPSFGNSTAGGAPCSSVFGAEIKTTGTGSGYLAFATGATHYRIGPGIRFTDGATTSYTNALQSFDQVDHIIYDRDWFAADPVHENAHGLQIGCGQYIAVVDSFFSNIHCDSLGACSESQGILGGSCTSRTNSGPVKIVNNYIEGGGESYLFGGGSAVATTHNIEIRHNWLNIPQIWNPSSPTYDGGLSGHNRVVKNLGEFKNGAHALVEGNVHTNMWCGFTQQGFGYLITPKAYDDIDPTRYNANNITIRWERVDSVGSGIQFQDIPNTHVAATGYNYSMHDLLLTNLNYATAYQCTNADYIVSLTSANGGYATFGFHDVKIDHLTIIGQRSTTTWPIGFLIGGASATLNPPEMFNFTLSNSVWFDGPGSANGGYGKALVNIQRTGGVVTAHLAATLGGFTRQFLVGGHMTVTGVSDNSFNSCAAAPCASGNFTLTGWDLNTTLTWNQAGPDTALITTGPGTIGAYGCDFQNANLPGVLTGCFNPLTFSKNVIYGSTTHAWPGVLNTDYFTPTSAAVQFTNYTGDATGNYLLQVGSPYHLAGTDGKDIGVSDMNKLFQITAGVDTLP